MIRKLLTATGKIVAKELLTTSASQVGTKVGEAIGSLLARRINPKIDEREKSAKKDEENKP